MMPRRLRVAAVPPAGLRRPTLFDCRAPSFGSLSSARELPSVDFNMKSVRQCRYADLQIGPEAVASCCLAGSLLFFLEKNRRWARRDHAPRTQRRPDGRWSLAVEVVGATRAPHGPPSRGQRRDAGNLGAVPRGGRSYMAQMSRLFWLDGSGARHTSILARLGPQARPSDIGRHVDGGIWWAPAIAHGFLVPRRYRQRPRATQRCAPRR